MIFRAATLEPSLAESSREELLSVILFCDAMVISSVVYYHGG